jgi:hypothetical protein
MDITEQVLDAQRVLREHMWQNREEIVDYLILHDCGLRSLHEALVVLAGLDASQWVMGVLSEDRAHAES